MINEFHDVRNTKNVPKFFGIYVAQVVDNMDPKGLERVKVRVVGIHDMSIQNEDYAVWAERCCPSKYINNGDIPDIGDWVYVMFLNGDPMRPVWLGYVRWIE